MDSTESESNNSSILVEPEHSFETHIKTVKGKNVFITKLVITPYIFSLRKQKKTLATFSCDSCQRLGTKVYAKADLEVPVPLHVTQLESYPKW